MRIKPHDPASILIVDGDPLTLTALAATLHYSGRPCRCARDREAALKAARTLPIDLVICEIDLGNGEDGLELCRELKRQPGLDQTPILFLSRREGPDIVQRSREAGGAYYVRKPFDPEVLIELVDKALWMPHLIHAHARRDGASARSLGAGKIPPTHAREPGAGPRPVSSSPSQR